MATSQNGWEALPAGSPLLFEWTVPAKNGEVKLLLRNGSAGFLLVHLLTYLSENVEDLTMPGVPDDWGYSYRDVIGFGTLSNHASGTAVDANATRHPLGKRNTFTARQMRKIRGRLAWRMYQGCIRWGGDYHTRADEMHFEINRPMAFCEKAARALMVKTSIGVRVIAANPSQKAVILS